MTETIFFDPRLKAILHDLTAFPYHSQLDLRKAEKQVKNIIKDLFIRKLLRYYHTAPILLITLDNNAEARLIKYLKKLHYQRGEATSDEEIKQEIEQMNALIDGIISELAITEESVNA